MKIDMRLKQGEANRAALRISNTEFRPDRHSDRQMQINNFSQAVKAIIRQDQPRSFNHEQIIVMLLELAKNTFDHSNGIGHLEIRWDDPLQISYGDTGAAFDVDVCSRFGVSQKIGNGINFGMGLPLIMSGAKGAGFKLYIQRLNNATEFKFEKFTDFYTTDKN